jgi:hypothetical protein
MWELFLPHSVVDPAELMPEPTSFVAFCGEGNKLDGKKRKTYPLAGKLQSKWPISEEFQITITK